MTLTETALAMAGAVELSLLLKATIILTLGLTATWLARRARASRRHLLLAGTFASLLALPVVGLAAPEVTFELPAAPAAAIAAAPAAAQNGAAPAPAQSTPADRAAAAGDAWSMPSWAAIARAIWLSGALVLLALLAVDLYRVNRLRRNGLPSTHIRRLTESLATEAGIRRAVDVLHHEEIAAPMTCGARRPAIMLPVDADDASETDVRRAIVHELEHVRRGDWIVQLAARVACSVYWFHPLAWMAWRRMSLEAERACDDAVVARAERTDYAEQLVTLARRMSTADARTALGMANRSDLSARVDALLDGDQPRGRAGMLAAAAVICVASLIVVALGPVRAVARPAAPRVAAGQQEREKTAEVGPLDRALYDAAGSGDVAGILKLVDEGANVNCAIDGDGSPLIAAAREGWIEAVMVLLDRGADPNMAVPGDGTALIMAARDGHAKVVALLLDRGAQVDLAVPDDENALIQASAEGRLDVVKLLVSRGANVNTRIWVESTVAQPNGEYRSPLGMARKGRHDSVVAYLRSVGARE